MNRAIAFSVAERSGPSRARDTNSCTSGESLSTKGVDSKNSGGWASAVIVFNLPSNSTAQPKSQDSHHPSPAWYCAIATPKNATIRAVEQALEFVDAVCATGLASGRTNRCTAAQLRCASQDRDDGRNIVRMGASPGTGGGQQFDGIPARHRPGRL